MKQLLILMTLLFGLGQLTACGGGGGGGGGDDQPTADRDDDQNVGDDDMGNYDNNNQDPGDNNNANNQSQFVHDGATVTSTCVGCTSNENIDQSNDGDDATFAEASFLASSASGLMSMRVDAMDGASFPAGAQVGARLFLQGTVNIVYTVTVNTYLGDVQQESFGPQEDVSGTIDPEEFVFTSTQPYDAVETVVQFSGATPATGTRVVRHFEFRG